MDDVERQQLIYAYNDLNRLHGDVMEFFFFSKDQLTQAGQLDEVMAKIQAYDDADDKLQQLIFNEPKGEN